MYYKLDDDGPSLSYNNPVLIDSPGLDDVPDVPYFSYLIELNHYTFNLLNSS